ncbi:MAG: bifunctional DNA primase/polymerase [Chloroflexota bacterium]
MPILLDQARAYVRQGYSLIPTYYASQKPFFSALPQNAQGKATWKVFKSRKPTEQELENWFAKRTEKDAGMAAVCGRVSGNLIVIDFDYEAEQTFWQWMTSIGELAGHLKVSLTGKGFHVPVRARNPELCKSKELAWTSDGKVRIEIKGEGGLCMLPPSIHKSGKPYTWIRSPGEVPVFDDRQMYILLGMASRLNMQKEEVVSRSTLFDEVVDQRTILVASVDKRIRGYACGVLRNECRRLSEKAEGGRNTELNRVAFWLGRWVGGGFLSKNDVVIGLEDACRSNSLISDDGESAFLATVESGLTAGMSKKLQLAEALTIMTGRTPVS